MTYAKIQNVTTNRLLGRSTVGSGDTEEITPSDGLTLASGLLKAKVLQIVNTQTGTSATGTTTVPYDDTIPQNTEGTEFMTLAITPVSASSQLDIEVVFNFSYSAANTNVTAALFVDSTADALAAAHGDTGVLSADSTGQIGFRHRVASGSTSARTYKLRAGGDAAGTITFNGDGGAQRYGGVMASSIRITEVL